jgi:transmembrane sensor
MKHKTNLILIEKILSGTASTKENEEFNAWISASAEHKNTYERIKVIWEKLDGVYAGEFFDKAAAKAKISAIVQAKTISKRTLFQKVKEQQWLSAAALLPLILSLWLFIGHKKSGDFIIYKTESETREIVLSDNSRVWLNRNSSLKVPHKFKKNSRSIELTGEAFFEIHRDESRPFSILAGKTITKVLGTSFNIYHNTVSNKVDVTVKTGRVAFYKNNLFSKKIILMPNDIGQYDPQTKSIHFSTNKNLNFLSWKTGVLTFYDTPLIQVCMQLSKHYQKEVKITKSAADLTLTGEFQNETLQDVLNTIALTLGLKVKNSDNLIILSN